MGFIKKSKKLNTEQLLMYDKVQKYLDYRR